MFSLTFINHNKQEPENYVKVQQGARGTKPLGSIEEIKVLGFGGCSDPNTFRIGTLTQTRWSLIKNQGLIGGRGIWMQRWLVGSG